MLCRERSSIVIDHKCFRVSLCAEGRVCVKVRVFCANSELCGTSMCHESTLYNVWGICMLWAGFVCFGVGLSGGQSLGTVSRNCKGYLDDSVMNGRDACFEHVSSL